jgi:hypothetical protein
MARQWWRDSRWWPDVNPICPGDGDDDLDPQPSGAPNDNQRRSDILAPFAITTEHLAQYR